MKHKKDQKYPNTDYTNKFLPGWIREKGNLSAVHIKPHQLPPQPYEEFEDVLKEFEEDMEKDREESLSNSNEDDQIDLSESTNLVFWSLILNDANEAWILRNPGNSSFASLLNSNENDSSENCSCSNEENGSEPSLSIHEIDDVFKEPDAASEEDMSNAIPVIREYIKGTWNNKLQRALWITCKEYRSAMFPKLSYLVTPKLKEENIYILKNLCIYSSNYYLANKSNYVKYFTSGDMV
ncbi:Protein of unknown function, partial [Gryllus bimaculatus]